MATPFNLGNTPLRMTVTLTKGADFVATLRNDGGDWPSGIAVRLDFDDPDATIWSATIVDDEIRFNVDKAAVDTLLDAGPNTANLVYVDGTADLGWARGPVVPYV